MGHCKLQLRTFFASVSGRRLIQDLAGCLDSKQLTPMGYICVTYRLVSAHTAPSNVYPMPPLQLEQCSPARGPASKALECRVCCLLASCPGFPLAAAFTSSPAQLLRQSTFNSFRPLRHSVTALEAWPGQLELGHVSTQQSPLLRFRRFIRSTVRAVFARPVDIEFDGFPPFLESCRILYCAVILRGLGPYQILLGKGKNNQTSALRNRGKSLGIRILGNSNTWKRVLVRVPPFYWNQNR
jgi:hypothetical protein